jgi:hypothetical protein
VNTSKLNTLEFYKFLYDTSCGGGVKEGLARKYGVVKRRYPQVYRATSTAKLGFEKAG